MKIYIEEDSLYYPEIKYIFSIFCSNKGIRYGLIKSKEGADLIVSDQKDAHIKISRHFYEKLSRGIYKHNEYFIDTCEIRDPDGFVDYLSTAFYILAGIQEVNHENEDQFGRFKYEESLQYKFDNVRQNIVNILFDKLYLSIGKLNKNANTPVKSKIFLSHDIDTVFGSLIQDSFNSFKKGRIDLIFKIILENLLSRPSWLNMDRIMKIESEYDFYSTFYWLVNKGYVSKYLNNSDYNINSKAIKSQINYIAKSKCENGLHKSSSDDSFRTEIKKMGIEIKGNRYHYLKFKLHQDFSKIEESGLEFDSSIGFANAYGFRTGYGLPYKPYSLSDRRAFNFVECPLNIMDTTFFNYLKMSASEMSKAVIEFCELNREGCIISVLFHNNYISNYKYKNYFNAFKTLLKYFYDSGFKCITQSEIIDKFKNEHSD